MAPTRNLRKQRVIVMQRIKYSGATSTTNILASTSNMQQIATAAAALNINQIAPIAAISTRMTRSRAAREIAAIHQIVPIATTSTRMTRAARENATALINEKDVATTSAIIDPVETSRFRNKWAAANRRLKLSFYENELGFSCNVCDRLWFKKDLKICNVQSVLTLLQAEFPGKDVTNFLICQNCKINLLQNKIPALSTSNGFQYPVKPNLPELDVITERLISPRLPFMEIRRLRYQGYSIVGQVINVPVDVPTIVKTLPRNLSDDYAFNVNIKKITADSCPRPSATDCPCRLYQRHGH